MTPTRRVFGAALLSVGLLMPSAVSAADPIDIVGRFFSEVRSIGATKADHGPITYDPGTQTLVIPDITIDWPISVSLGKAGSITIDTTMTAPEVRIVGLREVDGGYRMDEFRYGDGTRMNVMVAAGEATKVDMTFNGTVYSDMFWPYLPTIQSDPNLPASRYFPYLRWAVQFETGHAILAHATLEQDGPEGSYQKTVYENLELKNYRAGRIEEYRLARTVSETFAKQAPVPATGDGQSDAEPQMSRIVRLEMGPIVYRGYDVGAMVRLIDPESYLLGNTDPEFHTILDEATVSDIKIDAAQEVTARISRYAVDGAKLRQPKQSIFAFIDRLLLGDEPAEEDIVAFAFSALQSMAFERGTIDDIRINAPDDTAGHIERISLRDLSADGIGEFSIERVKVNAANEGDFELGLFRFAGLVFPKAEAIVHMVKIADQGDPPIRAALDVVPMLSVAEVSKVAAHLKGGIDLSLDLYKSEMSDHIPPIPTKWRERIENLVLPVVAFQEEPDAVEFIRALGLNEVRVNSEMSIRWDEDTQDLIIAPIAVDIAGAASATFEARIAGVPRLVFENPEAAQAALATLAFTSMRFELHNEKLVQTALDKFAREQGMTPDQARDVLLAQLRQMLGTLNSPAFAEQVNAAMAEFLANPRTLTITAEPNTPMPATQILGSIAMAPQAIIEQLNVKVEAR